MTPRGLSGVLRIPIYAANTAFRRSDAGGCDWFRAGCGFQEVSTGELPRVRRWPLISRSRQTSSDGTDEFAQLPDQDRLEVDFTLGRLPVGALEGRLQSRSLSACGDKRHIVAFGLIKQSGPLYFIAIEVRGIHRPQLSAQGDEGNLQFLAITPQCSGELARPRLGHASILQAALVVPRAIRQTAGGQ